MELSTNKLLQWIFALGLVFVSIQIFPYGAYNVTHIATSILEK